MSDSQTGVVTMVNYKAFIDIILMSNRSACGVVLTCSWCVCECLSVMILYFLECGSRLCNRITVL